MTRTRGRKLDQKNGPFFFIMLALVVSVLWSVAVAFATADECPGSETWRFFPPGWECQTGPNVIG
jgi:hypothetical protein